MEQPHFFVDRSLGAVQVPQLLRASGWILTTLAEHYGKPGDESIADVDWLELCGARSWPVLMKDARIRYRSAEADALLSARVSAFCLSSGNLRSADMAEIFVKHQDLIWEEAARRESALWVLTRKLARPVDL